jgi:hypothetical protein
MKPNPDGSGAAAEVVAVSFVIPVRNDARGLSKCLKSIESSARQSSTNIECIVVDNGSEDDSAEVAIAAGCRVLIVPNERVGALRNGAAAAAQGPLLAFVDADHEIALDWIGAAVGAMADLKVSAVGAPCNPPTPASWVQRAYNGLRDHGTGTRQVDWLGSGNLVVRREVFRRVGGFDGTLEACEDVDLCRRIRDDGGIILRDHRLGNIHLGDPISLRAVFKGELWRGRNNLRVSLRDRPSFRGLPSIVIPVLQLTMIIAVLSACASRRPQLAGICAGVFSVASAARAYRIYRRTRVPFANAAAVALTYDLARALALLVRVPHRRAGAPAFRLSR